MEELTVVQRIAIWVMPVLFAITVHEVAHGWVARRFGDPTAMMLGRLTLNPVKHIDPVGTILVPGVMLLLNVGFLFGWAKPVPVTWENLRNPRRDMAWVAVAGPASNLLMAVLWALVIRLGVSFYGTWEGAALFCIYTGTAGIFVNVLLMVINLLPIPPLDGGRVLAGMLPGPAAYRLSQLEPYGFMIVLLLLMTGVLGWILSPLMQLFFAMSAGVAGLSAEQLWAVRGLIM